MTAMGSSPDRDGDEADARARSSEDQDLNAGRTSAAKPGIRWRDFIATAIWAGVLVGFVELGLFIARIQFTQHGLYRKTPHFLWMIPASNAIIFAIAGASLTIFIRPLPKAGEFLAKRLLCSLAMMTPLLSIPGLRTFSCLFLALGLSCWIVPSIQKRAPGFRRLVRRSSPPLALAWLALAGICFGRDYLANDAKTYPLASELGSPTPPNVLLIVMDTVRADAASLNGAVRNTTPNLNALAAKGARFDHAMSTCPWTLPSHASMFTGRWPWELSAGANQALDARYPTLAQHFQRQGYATAGFVANTVFCSREYGLSRGFGYYEDFVVTPLEIFRGSALGWLICRRLAPVMDRACLALGREADHPLEIPFHRKNAEDINQAALRWIAKQGDRPFFAFLNYLDAHDPYLLPQGEELRFRTAPATLAERRVLRDWIDETPRKRTPSELRLARDFYDECLAYLDDQMGRLVAELERRGLSDRTVIIVTSDHGEHFGEHARDGSPLVGHRLCLYQPEIHVPLAIVAPGRIAPGTTIAESVSLRDLAATIVNLAGLQKDSPFPGRDLLAQAGKPDHENAASEATPNAAFSEFSTEQNQDSELRYRVGAPGLMRAVVTEGMAYYQHSDGSEELYDLSFDPKELNDVSSFAEYGPLLDGMRDQMNDFAPTR